jgi:hypothetical protein
MSKSRKSVATSQRSKQETTEMYKKTLKMSQMQSATMSIKGDY